MRRSAPRVAALGSAVFFATAGLAAAATPGSIVTVAGLGTSGSTGDGGPAITAELNSPYDAQPLPSGGFLIADRNVSVVRRVSASGDITTVAGQAGAPGVSGDGRPATSAKLDYPTAVAVLSDSSFLIADEVNDRIREVDADGVISTVAGGGTGFTEGASATSVALPAARDVAALPGGGFLIAAYCRVLKVDAAGRISTVAGTDCGAGSGDGGPATAAVLNGAVSVAPLPDGGFLVADSFNNRVRKVDAAGTISTVAGDGAEAFAGDGGAATLAEFDGIRGLAALPAGGFLLADLRNERIRQVGADGIISTVAGNGSATTGPGDLGEGGPATAATLVSPQSVVPLPDGGLLISDTGNHRVRQVIGQFPVNTAAPGITGTDAPGSRLTCTPGTWTYAPGSYAYTWRRDGGPVVSSAATYAVTAADVGHALTCSVVAMNDVGPSTSAATSAAFAIPVPPVSPPPPASPPPPVPPAPPVKPHVVLPSNAFRVARTAVGKDGSITVTLILPGRGKVTVLATSTTTGAAKPRKLTYARRTLVVKKAGRTTIRLRPTRTGRLLLKRLRHRHRALRVRLVETFTPAGGVARRHTSIKTVMRARRR